MTPLRQAVKAVMTGVLPAGRLLVRGEPHGGVPATPIPPGATTISLTFDDGPDPQWTPAVLDALDHLGWIGTFFVIGQQAEAYPDLVREIAERGHEIGNHSFAHGDPDETGVREFVNGVFRTQQLLTELTDRHVTLTRPPKGHLDLWKTRALWRAGQSVVLWNVDPRDFRLANTRMAVAWSQEYEPATGDIVLLHDRLPYAAQIVRALGLRNGDALHSIGVSHWLTARPRASLTSTVRAIGNFIIS